jgi:hypothetical protein
MAKKISNQAVLSTNLYKDPLASIEEERIKLKSYVKELECFINIIRKKKINNKVQKQLGGL